MRQNRALHFPWFTWAIWVAKVVVNFWNEAQLLTLSTHGNRFSFNFGCLKHGVRRVILTAGTGWWLEHVGTCSPGRVIFWTARKLTKQSSSPWADTCNRHHIRYAQTADFTSKRISLLRFFYVFLVKKQCETGSLNSAFFWNKSQLITVLLRPPPPQRTYKLPMTRAEKTWFSEDLTLRCWFEPTTKFLFAQIVALDNSASKLETQKPKESTQSPHQSVCPWRANNFKEWQEFGQTSEHSIQHSKRPFL